MTPATEPFRWPPRASAPPPRDESPDAGAMRRVAPGPAWTMWSEFERAFLAPTALPVRERAADVGWRPDGFDAYCERCGRTTGPHEAEEFGCSACRDRRLMWARMVRLGAYESHLADWVQEVKFTRWRAQAVALGRWLGERCRDAGVDAACAEIVVVPVPTTFRRRMLRGIDHAGLIALGVAQELRCPLVRALRRAHRPSQRSVAASERERNAAGSMRLVRAGAVEGRLVVLVDDVTTSGATLRAAARVIRAGQRRGDVGRASAGIWAAVVAVTPEHG